MLLQITLDDPEMMMTQMTLWMMMKVLTMKKIIMKIFIVKTFIMKTSNVFIIMNEKAPTEEPTDDDFLSLEVLMIQVSTIQVLMMKKITIKIRHQK